ncbi:MAG: hypothetical protein J7604_12540 [Sporocytophaga sp.]|uniref:hypothetical protein n=1 Tax=Sporocytophaga sp. TaxID=2231183 RepID=UPI001B173320|nr:hypothetical protein [Sporocytophaga sp.]MBO9701033.1 hypothetical protein [Sporocytophaga sp.]
MIKKFKSSFNIISIILTLLILSFTGNLRAQNTIIYKGDSIKLSLDTYRGQVMWQKAAEFSGLPVTWSDIPGASFNNYWAKPTEHTFYRAKVTEGTCNPVVYSPEKLVLISSQPGVSITVTAPTNVTHSTANVAALVQRLGGDAKVTARGICWGTSINPTIENTKTINGTGTGSFNAVLTGLQENTTYYVRGYITTDNIYSYYGADPPNIPYFTFKTPYRVNVTDNKQPETTFNTATLKSDISFNGSSVPIVSKGIVYRTVSDYRIDKRYPDLSDTKTVDGSGNGPFITNLTNLKSGGYYIYRSYATTADGVTYYSEGWTFKTLQSLTAVLSGVGRLESNRADIGITVYGTGSYSEKGVCYGLSPTPTIAGSNSQTGILLPLNPNSKYYARAYVIDSIGTVIYGNEISFTTLPLNSQPLIITNFGATLEAGIVYTNSIIEGSGTIINKGICYDVPEDQPVVIITTDNNKTSEGPGSGAFSSALNGLTKEGTYFYRAYATLNNGTTIYSGYKYFFFYDFIDADVQFNKIVSIQHNAAVFSSKAELIEGTGRGTISSRGICYSTEPNPSVGDSKVIAANSSGDIQTTITGLKPNTTYYARAYVVVNAYGEGYSTYYSDELSFTTFPSPLASVTTETPSSIANTSVVLGGKIIVSDIVTERGICWSLSPSPSILGNKVIEGAGAGSFTIALTGLTPGMKYYAKAYAITNSSSTMYGDEVSFTTEITPITISTSTVSGITPNSAMSGGSVILEGGMAVNERGICYGISGGPTISNSKTSNGQGAGTYTSTLTDLTVNTTYYVRAYATDHTNKTHYGDEVSFTTPVATTFQVTTTPMTNIQLLTPTYSGTSGGTVSGTGTISAKGVCWNSAENPTIDNSKTTNGTGLSAFSSIVTGLNPGTTYYYRAYATSSTGTTVYGEQYSVYYATTITTELPYNVQGNTASSGGNVPTPASGTITVRGVCWSTTENPTIVNSKTSDGTGPGTYSSSMTGLTVNTTYYVRAYATLSTGNTYYGNQRSLTTYQAGTVSVATLAASNLTDISAEIGGKVIGQENIQARGICYGTVQNPSLSNKIITAYTWSTDYLFNLKATGLTENTLYYARAYATLSNGETVYGNQISFTTPLGPSYTITTAPVSDIQPNWVMGGGTYSGPGIITDKGVAFGISPNPIAYSAGTGTSQMPSETTTFQGHLGPLQPNTLYYVRAYIAAPSGKIFYGNQITFTSGSVKVDTYNSQLEGMSATLNGNITLYSGATITDKGFCWSATNMNPSITDNKTSQGTVSGLFSTKITGLSTSTIYAYRAYAITSSGTTIYGEVMGFITRDHATIVVETRGSFEKTTTSLLIGGEVINEGSEVVTSRGICYDATNPTPTTSDSKVISGSGNGAFGALLSGLQPSTRYYYRAYAITNAGKTVYGRVIMGFTLTYDNIPPPAPDPQEPTPPNNGGGTDGSGGFTPGTGDRYLMFGRVFGPAKQDCREGSNYFQDYKAYGILYVEGKYTKASYDQAKTSLDGQMKAKYYGDKYSYSVESSADYNVNYRYAVIIEYKKKISGWDCYSVFVTIGYGNSYDEALTHALSRKNKDTNNGDKAPYKVLKQLQW